MAPKTRPDIKWLLVERGTLVGDIAQLEKRRTLVDAEIARLEALVVALDISIRLTEARVRPDAAGSVQRHRQSYGRRGALRDFIVQTLQNAEDRGLSAREVTLLVSAQFKLHFVSKTEFNRYLENSIHPRLRELREKGFVANVPNTGRDGMLWRWKRTLPVISDLSTPAQVQVTAGTSGAESEPKKGTDGADNDPYPHADGTHPPGDTTGQPERRDGVRRAIEAGAAGVP